MGLFNGAAYHELDLQNQVQKETRLIESTQNVYHFVNRGRWQRGE